MYDDPGDMILDRVCAAPKHSPIAVFEISDVVERKERSYRLKAVFGATIATRLLIQNMECGTRMPIGMKLKLQTTPRGAIRYRRYLGVYHAETVKKYKAMLGTDVRMYKLFGST